MENKQAAELLERFKNGDCSESDRVLLEYWVHHLNETGHHGLSDTELEDASVAMWAKIDAQQPAKVKPMRYWTAVAAALVIFAAAALLFNHYNFNNQAVSSLPQNRLANTIKVGGNKAVLTLASGKKIILDDVTAAHITNEDGVSISKTAAGQLVYSFTQNMKDAAGKVAYNTINTPNGGQYQVNLPDGTKVWLNAATTFRFPLYFQNNSRLVELSGEGYFEVKHLEPVKGEKVKFTVKTIGHTSQMVEVLGTHFNINAYNNEDVVKTTLLEGSVRVTPIANSVPHGQNITLKPGEQSIVNKNQLLVTTADVEDVVAWKNGYFRFNDEKLESIMRKVERWYNVDVHYQDDALKKVLFAGVTTRFANVAELLKMLELTGEVKFRIEGNSIFVLSKK